MSINFYIPNFDKNEIPKRASRRFRAIVPLKGMRTEDKIINNLDSVKTGEIVVVAKKIKYNEVLYLKNIDAKIVLDICDSKFRKSGVGENMIDMCNMVNLVTTTNQFLASEIKTYTGKDAYIIDDPTERKKLDPFFPNVKIHDRKRRDTIKLFYYGSEKNFACLKFKKIIDDIKKISNFNVFINVMIDRPEKYIDELKDYIENNIIKIYDFDYYEQEKLIKDSDIILLPINSKDFNKDLIYQKSPNRVIDAIQMGKIVITNSGVGSYEKFKDFVYWNDNHNYEEAINWILNNKEQVIKKITEGQKYIDQHHTPEIIGKQWIGIEKII
jgi:glycosyltransferase involved in cell wall biosynthesis